MRKEYDFSDSVRNPCAKYLKKQVTLRLNTDAITYFKALAEETGLPYVKKTQKTNPREIDRAIRLMNEFTGGKDNG